ncbi:hypothetical protein EDC01DRAFT_634581 [Geopyxis carbonaria]|nr:hypothetical protein EDC01DRAFT_634581 [Geopyxis carbonaria]
MDNVWPSEPPTKRADDWWADCYGKNQPPTTEGYWYHVPTNVEQGSMSSVRFVEKSLNPCSNDDENVNEADVFKSEKPTAPTNEHRDRKQTNWYHDPTNEKQPRISSGDNAVKKVSQGNMINVRENVTKADHWDSYKPTAPIEQKRYRMKTNWYHNQTEKQRKLMSSCDDLAEDLD